MAVSTRNELKGGCEHLTFEEWSGRMDLILVRYSRILNEGLIYARANTYLTRYEAIIILGFRVK